MEKFITKISKLGIKVLIYLATINMIGLYTPPALAVSLGPSWLLGGPLLSLCERTLIKDAIKRFGAENIYYGVLQELLANGETKDSMIASINRYSISSQLKQKVIADIINFHNTTDSKGAENE